MEVASELRPSDGRLRMRVKTGWFKGALALGIGAGGGLGLMLEVAQIFGRDPREGFDVLKSWGPWALVVGLVVWLVYQLASKSIDTARDAMNAWVGTAKTQAEASTRTADALTKLAQQGGRSAEEVQRLTIYTAQEFPSLYLRLDKQDDALDEIKALVHGLAVKFDAAQGREGT